MRGRAVTLALASALLFAPLVTAQESRPATVRFVILHTNDVHGQLRAVPDARAKGSERPAQGGYQEMVAAIDDERSKVAHSVLVDAGDWFQGTPEGTLSHGRCSVELMNATGYDFATLGNHDFDDGELGLADLLDLARFRPFARNLAAAEGTTDQASGPEPRLRDLILDRVLAPPPVVVVEGFRIAFDGLVSEETPRITSKRVLTGLTIGTEHAGAMNALLKSKTAGKADALVLVNHVGKDNNAVIARDVPGIDIIIGGHNHRDVLDNGIVVESTGTLLAQGAASSQALGVITLEIDPVAKKIVSKTARLRRIMSDPSIRVPRIAPIVERYEKSVAAMMDVPVAAVPEALARDWNLDQPSSLGNWMTQAMLDRTHADVAIHNVGGVRAAIPAGTARVREFFQVSPFGNRLVTLRVRVRDVREVCERTARGPTRGCHFRGIEIHWKPGADGTPVVTRLIKDGKVLADDDELLVATTDFLAGGADNFPSLKNGAGLNDTGLTLLEATLEAARAQQTLVAPAGNAWVRDPN